ncbi:unnamed protein product [Caenorhabditis angaria]|uniref:SXP/RAL-2 family protein Ani s 5-like cation-binding domain-containing protein n=1 Tax=Caenorhabditis angaria TaxID=860376 RepID=A0A9P1N4Z5_9PELO|nr:unnamed protein product [Caenorhabditis angaria]
MKIILIFLIIIGLCAAAPAFESLTDVIKRNQQNILSKVKVSKKTIDEAKKVINNSKIAKNEKEFFTALFNSLAAKQ